MESQKFASNISSNSNYAVVEQETNESRNRTGDLSRLLLTVNRDFSSFLSLFKSDHLTLEWLLSFP